MKPNSEESFWAMVSKGNGCWEWTGRTTKGYGRLRFWGKTRRAHRVAYALAVAPVPDEIFVCHACDNPKCVRPDHLFLGTAIDNNADMVAKARHATGERCRQKSPATGERHGSKTDPLTVRRGERHYAARLLQSDVDALREAGRTAASRDALSAIITAASSRFGVSRDHVAAIIRGAKWRHEITMGKTA